MANPYHTTEDPLRELVQTMEDEAQADYRTLRRYEIAFWSLLCALVGLAIVLLAAVLGVL